MENTAGFEFSLTQNETIGILAGRMKFVGIFYIVMGVLLSIGALVTLLTVPFASVVYVLAALLEILIGIWTTNAAASFKLIVETSGNDMAHLNDALESLRKLYNLQFWLLVVVIGLIILVLLFLAGGLLMMSSVR